MDAGLSSKKEPNPRENATPLSAATFFYTIPTFLKGRKKDLEVADLYETLKEHKSGMLGDKLERIWNSEVESAKRRKRRPSLRRVIVKAFVFEFFLLGIALVFLELVVKIFQPIWLGLLVSYYSPDPNSDTHVTKVQAYLYAAGVVLCSLLTVLISHPFTMGMVHMGMKVRVACCSLIYRKALRLNKTALGQTTPGQLVNLLSNDVNRFDNVVLFVHFIWIGPLQTAIVTYFMYQQVQISALFGVVFLLLVIPLQFLLGKMSLIYRLKTAVRTDERVRLMNEIIAGIQVIKMYTWEKPFAKLVGLSRRFEIRALRGSSYIKGAYTSFIMFITRTSTFISILAFVLLGHSIDAQKAFMLTAFYNTFKVSMCIFFPQGLAFIAETLVSIDRLNDFLLFDEVNIEKEAPEPEKFNSSVFNEISEKDEVDVDHSAILTLESATAKWTTSSSENTLTDLNMSIKRGSLIAVIGPVGCGKTSLMHVILKELPLLAGKVNVRGEVSYASQEPWLFTGTVRQNILFGQKMNKELYRIVTKKCALERDFALFPYGDRSIVGERGASLSGGQRARISLARAVYKNADIYLLDDPLSAVDTHVGKQLFDDCIKGHLRNKTVILVTHQLQYLKNVDYIYILQNGHLNAQGNFRELQNSGLDFAKLLESSEKDQDEASEEDHLLRRVSIKRRVSVDSSTSTEDQDQLEVEEQKSKGSISIYVYKAYILAAGNCRVLFTVVFLCIVAQASAVLGDYFINYWVNLEQDRHVSLNDPGSSSFWSFSTETSIYIYSALIIATIVSSLAFAFAFFEACLRASITLHDRMFGSIIRATMRFFTTNTSGRILNRFSKDIGAIDERLPVVLIDCIQIGMSLLGIAVLVAAVNPWLMILAVAVAVIFSFFALFYLKTSRPVKRLEGITRSPVFAHLNASLQGMTTIRAFGAEKILEREFDNHQDLHSSAWHLFLATAGAFGYWLDIICVLYVALVTLSFFVIEDETYGGNVGLAITQSLTLTGMFQWGMRQATEVESQMTSVERVLEYTTLEHEPPLESPLDKKPPAEWPQKGGIQFVNLSLRYFPENPPVLKGLSFTIQPLEKVGIVGRTGAGKSSLIAALFRLSEFEGSIMLDQIDTKHLGLHDLRSKISIIPQEPVLFSGTMRKNLDPFEEYSDDVLWKALEDVELKSAVSSMSGLNSKMSEGGTNFSVGQRQLVCLARAIIRNNKILVLDEATANVDPQTDNIIQQTIRQKFAQCTVLTIAHRLHTIMDSDKVLVLDAGNVVEFDHPHLLLQNKNGIFYGMVQQSGKAMATTLENIAKDNYKKKPKQVT